MADLVAQVNPVNNTVTLKPNRINDPDPFWQTGNLFGNKQMDASFFINNTTDLVNTAFTFTGVVVSNNLDGEYTEKAFIRIFDGSFNLLREITADLTPGTFSIFYDNSEGAAGVNVQYGFNVVGRNANPDPSFDAAYDALGGVVITQATLSLDNFEKDSFSLFPNPVNNFLNIDGGQRLIQNLELYDLAGRLIKSQQPGISSLTVDLSDVNAGVYLLKLQTDQSVVTKKLIKK